MATLKDIAKHVGVSISAASLALRDHHSISLETKRKIWAAQEALGYRAPLRIPDALGSKGKKQKTALRKIAFLLVDRKFQNTGYGSLFQNVADISTQRHWRSMYVSASLKDLREGHLPPLLKSGEIDGIIVSGAYDSTAHQHVRKLGIPMIVYGRYELGDDPWASVEIDFSHGANIFASRMAAFGHTRCGLVIKGDVITDNNYRAYILGSVKKAVADKNLDLIGIASVIPHPDYLSVEELLRRKTTAILISGPAQAVHTYEVCRTAGLRIPDDVSVMSLYSAEHCLISPSLAYITAESGTERLVVEKLDRLMDDPDMLKTREIVPKRFCPGGSIGLCPGFTLE